MEKMQPAERDNIREFNSEKNEAIEQDSANFSRSNAVTAPLKKCIILLFPSAIAPIHRQYHHLPFHNYPIFSALPSLNAAYYLRTLKMATIDSWPIVTFPVYVLVPFNGTETNPSFHSILLHG